MTKSKAKWLYAIYAEPKSWKLEDTTVHGSINHKAEVSERRQKRGSNLVGFSRIIREHYDDRTQLAII